MEKGAKERSKSSKQKGKKKKRSEESKLFEVIREPKEKYKERMSPESEEEQKRTVMVNEREVGPEKEKVIVEELTWKDVMKREMEQMAYERLRERLREMEGFIGRKNRYIERAKRLEDDRIGKRLERELRGLSSFEGRKRRYEDGLLRMKKSFE